MPARISPNALLAGTTVTGAIVAAAHLAVLKELHRAPQTLSIPKPYTLNPKP